jgi:hypothetical protein
MVRGALYGTIGLAVGISWEGLLLPHLWLLIVPLFWALSLIITFPVMLVPAIPLLHVQSLLRKRLRGRLFLIAALLAALPFMLLLLTTFWALWGGPLSSYSASDGLFCLRIIVSGSIGLGLGCVDEILKEDAQRNPAFPRRWTRSQRTGIKRLPESN